jgi:hypothetical protein
MPPIKRERGRKWNFYETLSPLDFIMGLQEVSSS